jgi:hypothetical protein
MQNDWCNDVVEYARARFTSPILGDLLYYTDHSSRHSDRDWDYCEKLLALINPAPTELELSILKAATYLHDSALFFDETISRTLLSKYLDINTDPSAMGVETVAKIVREKHHIIAYHWLNDSNAPRSVLNQNSGFPLPFIGSEYRNLVALCVRAHRFTQDKKTLRDLLEGSEYRNFPAGSKGVVRMKLLGAILRLADELDITAEKALPDDQKAVTGESALYWHLHAHVLNVDIDPHGCISINTQIKENTPSADEIELVDKICRCHYKKIGFEYARLTEMGIQDLPKLNLIAETLLSIPFTLQHNVPDLDPLNNSAFAKQLEHFLDDQINSIERKQYIHLRREALINTISWLSNLKSDEREIVRKLNMQPVYKQISFSDVMTRIRYVGDPLELESFLDSMASDSIWTNDGAGSRLWHWTEQQWKICNEALNSFLS